VGEGTWNPTQALTSLEARVFTVRQARSIDQLWLPQPILVGLAASRHNDDWQLAAGGDDIGARVQVP
jgi:hypothetical protein